MRQHEYVPHSEFPPALHGRGGVDRQPVRQALLELEQMKVGEGVRLPLNEIDAARPGYVGKMVHEYAYRMGLRMHVTVRLRGGFLYIGKAAAQPPRRNRK